MAIPILIYGKSGSGKSRSLKEFEEGEIVLFNVISKDMPFKKRFKYEVCTDNYGAIKKALTEMPTDVAVILSLIHISRQLGRRWKRCNPLRLRGYRQLCPRL